MFGSNMFKGGAGGGFTGSYLADTDPASDVVFGRFKVETGLSDWMVIGHYDASTYQSCALMQNATFDTYLNCATGRTLGFQANGSTLWTIQDVAGKPLAPAASEAYDLGTSSKRVRSMYAGITDASTNGEVTVLDFALDVSGQTNTAAYQAILLDVTSSGRSASGTAYPFAIDYDASNVFHIDAAGGISVGAGSSSAPSIRSTADSDTGFYWNVSKVGCTVDGATGGPVWEVDYSGGRRIGFFGVTPAAKAAAYTPTNVTTDRSYDANSTNTDELADVLGTLIADLQAYGLLG